MKLAAGFLLLALGAGGCSTAPRPTTARTSDRSAVRQAERTHEYPSPRPRPYRTAAGAPSAVAAVSAFAAAYINWDAGSVARDMRALARRSVGQARAAMQLAAVQVTSDYELQRGGIANHGTVEAVAPLRAGPGRYVVVTRELTTSTQTTAYQGLRAAWHVAIATVSRERSGDWVLTGWQPEN